MRRPPTSRASGLSDAHKQLIRLLAAKAVNDYLTETDSVDTDAPAENLKEGAQ